MEEKKYKRKSILIVCNILLTLLLLLTTAVTITLAIQQFNMNIGGDITFNATDVQATISAGQISNGTVADSTNKMQQIVLTPENDGALEKATWEGLEITFNGLNDVIISFTVTNNHTESNLEMTLVTSYTQSTNMTISTRIDNSSKTSVIIPKQAEGNDNQVECEIIFHIENNLQSASIEGFSIEYAFENTEEEPASGYTVSIDSSATSLVSSLSSTSVGESEQVTFTSTAEDSITGTQIVTQDIKITELDGTEVPYTISYIEDSTQYSFTMPASDVTISVESQTLTRITDFAISSNVITAYTGSDTEVVVPATYYPYQQETGNTLRFETQEEFLSTGMTDYGFMYLMAGGHFSYKTNDSVEFVDVGNDGMTWLMETAMSFSQEQFPLEITLPTEYTLTQDDLIGGDQESFQILSPFLSMHISNNFILSFTYQIGDSSPIDVDMDIASEMVVNSIDNSLFNLSSMLPIKISNIKYGKTIACVGEGANIKALAFHAEITESDDVFVDNSTVTKITIDEGVTSLGYGSIRNCANLQELVLPSTLERIFNSSVFDNCPNLKYKVDNNGKYLGNSTNPYVLLMDVVDTSVSDFAVNSGCKIINTNFAGCSNLSNVTIPASVSFIYAKPNSNNIHYQGTLNQWLDISFKNSSSSGDNLYINNNQLVEEITISKNVKDFAFHGIDSLTKVTIVEGVTAISSGAFSSCSNLSEIVLPSTLTLIADGTFQECTSLKTVTIASEEIYSIVTGIGLDNAGGLLANATTVKVLKTIDDGSNTYLSSTDEFTLDNTSDPTYNIYTK